MTFAVAGVIGDVTGGANDVAYVAIATVMFPTHAMFSKSRLIMHVLVLLLQVLTQLPI